MRQNLSSYFTLSTLGLFLPLLRLLLLLLSLLLLRMFLKTKMSPSSTPTVLRHTDRHIFMLFRFCACIRDSCEEPPMDFIFFNNYCFSFSRDCGYKSELPVWTLPPILLTFESSPAQCAGAPSQADHAGPWVFNPITFHPANVAFSLKCPCNIWIL